MQAILFDALGTLVWLEPPAPRLRLELADRFGIEVAVGQAQAGLATEIRYYRANLNAGRDPDSLAALRSRCAEELRAGLLRAGVAGIERVRNRDLTVALLASLRFRAFDDAAPALRWARSEGRRAVVASNWDVSLPEVIERVGLAPALDGVVTSAQVGAGKPAPEIFRRALELAGAAPGEAWHVGDSLEEDVAGARAAGVRPVLISRDGSPGPPGVRTVTSLAELSTLGRP